MKKILKYKNIQFIFYLILAAVCVAYIVFISDTYYLIASYTELKIVCGMIWVLLAISFVFMFIDISLYSKQFDEIKALDTAAHSDSLAKMANRYGVDEIIDKYSNVSDIKTICCIMIYVTSIQKINENLSREEGDKQIKNFSVILNLAAVDKCEVGRNSGNVFLAIFDDSTLDEIREFLSRVAKLVAEYNEKKINKNNFITYKFGLAHNAEENVNRINELISIANSRTVLAGEISGIEDDEDDWMLRIP